MIEQPPPYLPPSSMEAPPKNPAQGCLHVIVWLAPIPILVPFVILASRLNRFSSQAVAGTISILLYLGFLIGAGWFHAQMSKSVRQASPEQRQGAVIKRTAIFCLIQIVIGVVLVPLVILGVLYAVCGGVKI